MTKTLHNGVEDVQTLPLNVRMHIEQDLRTWKERRDDFIRRKPLEQQILQYCLSREFYSSIKHILKEDMFEGTAKTVFRTIVDCHDIGAHNLSVDEVHSSLLTSNPALTQSTRNDIAKLFANLTETSQNLNLGFNESCRRVLG